MKAMPIEDVNAQTDRLISGGVVFSKIELKGYLEKAEVLAVAANEEVPQGYKRCGNCKEVKKFYLFNRNSSAKNDCTGNCKECQRKAAQKSYASNKHKRNYKKYYEENKEKKIAHNKKYYESHKEELAESHKKYRGTAKGKKVMQKAHAKRKALLGKNTGIPWTRELVIDRDKVSRTKCLTDEGEITMMTAAEYPICVLCGKPIKIEQDLHMEHLIPIVLGGLDCFTNVGCAHSLCNLRKTKDAREIEVEQVETLMQRSIDYMESHKEQFPTFFETTEVKDK